MVSSLYFGALMTWAILIAVEAKTPCPPLNGTDGVIISCEVSKTNNTKIPCQGPVPAVPKKTIAKYRCTGNETYSENVLECRCRGKWKGMDGLLSYKAACDSIQKNFSLDGPSELTFNQDVMQRLTSIANQNKQPDYAEDALAYHNYYRGLHGSSMLKLNSSLSDAAQRWADKEVMDSSNPEMEPWDNRSYISNIYWLTGPKNFDLRKAAKLAVGRWYQDLGGYDYQVPVANAFSAMIWNATTDLGVGIATKGNDVIVVCNYWPPGNVFVVDKNGTYDESVPFDSLALFKKNILPPVNNGEKGSVSMIVSGSNSTSI